MTKILKEGWMIKEGGFIRSWKKRWFVLNDHGIIYYTKKDGKEKGSFIINGDAIIHLDPTAKKQPAFVIAWPDKKRVYRMCGESYEIVSEWIKAIEKVIDPSKEEGTESVTIQKPNNSKPITATIVSPRIGASNQPRPSSSRSNKAKEESNQSRMSKNVNAHEENKNSIKAVSTDTDAEVFIPSEVDFIVRQPVKRNVRRPPAKVAKKPTQPPKVKPLPPKIPPKAPPKSLAVQIPKTVRLEHFKSNKEQTRLMKRNVDLPPPSTPVEHHFFMSKGMTSKDIQTGRISISMIQNVKLKKPGSPSIPVRQEKVMSKEANGFGVALRKVPPKDIASKNAELTNEEKWKREKEHRKLIEMKKKDDDRKRMQEKWSMQEDRKFEEELNRKREEILREENMLLEQYQREDEQKRLESERLIQEKKRELEIQKKLDEERLIKEQIEIEENRRKREERMRQEEERRQKEQRQREIDEKIWLESQKKIREKWAKSQVIQVPVNADSPDIDEINKIDAKVKSHSRRSVELKKIEQKRKYEEIQVQAEERKILEQFRMFERNKNSNKVDEDQKRKEEIQRIENIKLLEEQKESEQLLIHQENQRIMEQNMMPEQKQEELKKKEASLVDNEKERINSDLLKIEEERKKAEEKRSFEAREIERKRRIEDERRIAEQKAIEDKRTQEDMLRIEEKRKAPERIRQEEQNKIEELLKLEQLRNPREKSSAISKEKLIKSPQKELNKQQEKKEIPDEFHDKIEKKSSEFEIVTTPFGIQRRRKKSLYQNNNHDAVSQSLVDPEPVTAPSPSDEFEIVQTPFGFQKRRRKKISDVQEPVIEEPKNVPAIKVVSDSDEFEIVQTPFGTQKRRKKKV